MLSMLSCSLPPKMRDFPWKLEGNDKKKKKKAGAKAAGTVSALSSCWSVTLFYNCAPVIQGLPAHCPPWHRSLMLKEIQLQHLIEVDKLASSHHFAVVNT